MDNKNENSENEKIVIVVDEDGVATPSNVESENTESENTQIGSEIPNVGSVEVEENESLSKAHSELTLVVTKSAKREKHTDTHKIFSEDVKMFFKNEDNIKKALAYIVTAVVACGIGATADNGKILRKDNRIETLTSELKLLTDTTNKEISVGKAKVEQLEEKLAQAEPWFKLEEIEKSKIELNTSKIGFEKWISIMEVDKSYYDMTVEEKVIADELVETDLTKIPPILKEAYKEKFEKLVKDREVSVARLDAEEEARANKEAEEEAKRLALAEAKKYDTGLTWQQIAREEREGELCKFNGKVVQVIKGILSTQYRVATKGNYDNVMLITVPNSVSHDTVLEDDYISFKGESTGTVTYTTVMGAEMTIPSVEVHEYSIK